MTMNWRESKPLPSISCLCPKPFEPAQEILHVTADSASLSPQVKGLSDMNFLRDIIRSILPNLNENTLQNLVTRLIEEVGVESREDLIHVRETDFQGLLKPIQARKLIHSWKDNALTCVTHCSSVDPLVGAVESYRLVPVTEGSELQNFSVNTNPFQQMQPKRPVENLSVPYIVTVGGNDVPIIDTTTTTTTINEVRSVDNKNWHKSFSIPLCKMPPKIIDLLSNGNSVSTKAKRDIVRVVCEEIYSQTKRPSPKDLEHIAKMMTDIYPNLKEVKEGEEKDSDKNRVDMLYRRIKNRMSFKRKKDAQVTKRNDVEWIHHYEIPWTKLNSQTRTYLENGIPLELHQRREMIRVIVNDLIEMSSEPKPKILRILAQRMIQTYPDSLQEREKGISVDGSYESIYRNLEFRLHYLKKKQKRSDGYYSAEHREPSEIKVEAIKL